MISMISAYYGGYGYYGYHFDWTYLLVVLAMVLSMAASAKMRSTFHKYSRIQGRTRITGEEAAQRILNSKGIYDVRIIRTSGELTDHYNPTNRTLALSDSVYGNTSVAAVCVAAHECGHAVQHQEAYLPLTLRSAVVPVANLGSSLAVPVFIMGLIFSVPMLLNVGIILFMAAVLFQLITLPVEFNASSRALKLLESNGIMYEEEVKGAKKVLTAAALTYVAALAGSVLQLLRLVLLARGRDRD